MEEPPPCKRRESETRGAGLEYTRVTARRRNQSDSIHATSIASGILKPLAVFCSQS